jgi:hypothetical protein
MTGSTILLFSSSCLAGWCYLQICNRHGETMFHAAHFSFLIVIQVSLYLLPLISLYILSTINSDRLIFSSVYCYDYINGIQQN